MRVKKHIVDLTKITIGFITASFMKINNRNRDVWLISERRDEAEDNGYHLFKYIRENYPEKKVYYIIDKKSEGYKKIEKYKNIIDYNSLRHYIYYFLAEKHISAFQFFGVPDDSFIWKLEEKGLIKKKKVFIQHGVIQSKLPFLFFNSTKYSMFVCGAKPEFEYIKENYGYPEGAVKYLGLCRYDNLYNYEEENQILVMPTWRKWIGMTNKNSNEEEDINNFIKSEYYNTYKLLLTNKRLNNLLEENNYNLIFYPHPEMQRFISLFNSESRRIFIANRKEENLQSLLKKSKLLITDYSSVAFDYGYMKKGLIYYQFDCERYCSEHFESGYFNHKKDGFGPVVTNEDDLLLEIEKYIKSISNREVYIERATNFFKLQDKNNCMRNYEAIREL